ncbi:porin [Aquamicrobium ahrensii]|uniref:Porin n=1 Tax=Aquamicrobium ahrensii TaxID=469551 RepID=A0ABV2KIE3_9HYPH
MNIKSLLLGSAAALIAVSGARAADAIVVAEPEPAEYVRICDVYGAGFYYIPGTETCLKVGGYLRYDIGVGEFGHEDVLDKKNPWVTDAAGDIIDARTNDTYYKMMRAQINLDARSETEYGTLRGFIALNFQRESYRQSALPGPGGSIIGVPAELEGVISALDLDLPGISNTRNAWGIDHAIIQLGGLTLAYSDSLFETLTDSAGSVINDDLVRYSPGKSHYIAYTFDGGNGFSATVGVEEGAGVRGTIDSYVPHVVAGASFTQGWGKIAAVIGYDANFGEVAGKARVDVNVNDALSLWVMAGLRDGDNASYYGVWGGDWAVWGGGQYRFTEKAALDVQLSYDDAETFGAVVGMRYDVVPGLQIRPEIAYVDRDGDDNWGGYLRFQRSF